MKITFDPQADALYIRCTDEPAEVTTCPIARLAVAPRPEWRAKCFQQEDSAVFRCSSPSPAGAGAGVGGEGLLPQLPVGSI